MSDQLLLGIIGPAFGALLVGVCVWLVRCLAYENPVEFNNPAAVVINGLFTGPVLGMGGVAMIVGSVAVSPIAGSASCAVLVVAGLAYWINRRRAQRAA